MTGAKTFYFCPGLSSVPTPLSTGRSSGSGVQLKPAVRGKTSTEGTVFNFGEARVREYLSSLSSNSSESETAKMAQEPAHPILTLSPVAFKKKKKAVPCHNSDPPPPLSPPRLSEMLPVQVPRAPAEVSLSPESPPPLPPSESSRVLPCPFLVASGAQEAIAEMDQTFVGPMTRAKRKLLEKIVLQPDVAADSFAEPKRKRKQTHHHHRTKRIKLDTTST